MQVSGRGVMTKQRGWAESEKSLARSAWRDAILCRSSNLSHREGLRKKFKIRASRVMQTTILECDQALGPARRKGAVGTQEKTSKFARANCCKRQFSSTINSLDGWSKRGARRVVRDNYKCWTAFPASRQIDHRPL